MTPVSLYLAGKTLREIALAHHTSVKHIRAILQAEGIAIKKRGGRFNPNMDKMNTALSTYRRVK